MSEAQARTLFTNANLLDGDNPAQPNTTVVVEGNRIATVTQGPVGSAETDRVVDLAGKTLMPGMIQAHFHTGFGPVPSLTQPPVLGLDAPPAYMGMLAAKNAQTALQAGVTGFIGSSNPAHLDVALKEAMILGVVEGPRMLACTHEFLSSGDMADGTNRSWYMELGQHGLIRRVDGVDQVRQGVREELGRGCDIAKFSVSPGHGSAPARDLCYFTQEELNAAAEVAHERGKKVRAHCAARKAILMCAEAGFDIIDHADMIDDEGIEAVLSKDLSITPSMMWTVSFLAFAESWDHSAGTFPIGEGFPETLEQIHTRLAGVRSDFEYTCEMVPKMEKAGVRLLVGDDFGYPMMPHGAYVSEYEIYVKQLGIPALSVIRWATKNGGEAMGMGDELGTITEGKLADLLVVDGDPSQDISCLRDRIVSIMKDGAFVRDGLSGPLG